MRSLQEEVNRLFAAQLKEWPLAAANYEALNAVRTKEFNLGNYSLKVQFNPARAVSSLAKTDAKSIEARPCFLCEKNRPKEQTTVNFKGKYDILVNPFPICQKHFTIVSKNHELQSIDGHLDDMLDLAAELPDFVILYNGPKAGASAPDHFHFQAGNADFFPYPLEMAQEELLHKRICIAQTKDEVQTWFDGLIAELKKSEEEPMMNVFCQFKHGVWILTVFPRKAHRPAQYFAEGEEQLMISPGAIDMAGVLITVRENDFEKVSLYDIVNIYNQVSL